MCSHTPEGLRPLPSLCLQSAPTRPPAKVLPSLRDPNVTSLALPQAGSLPSLGQDLFFPPQNPSEPVGSSFFTLCDPSGLHMNV